MFKGKTILIIFLILMFSLVSFILGYLTKNTEKKAVEEPAPTQKVDTLGSYDLYSNPEFGISFSYPADWEGPEIQESESGFLFEIGTDTVYPPGVDRMQRDYTKFNSYYISFQYSKKPSNITNEDYLNQQPWLQDYLNMENLAIGQKRITQRSENTKVRNLEIKDYTGYEMISTLSETAQTEIFYVREIFLYNPDYDIIRISGSPNNVQVEDFSNWKKDYINVDEIYQKELNSLFNSLKIGDN